MGRGRVHGTCDHPFAPWPHDQGLCQEGQAEASFWTGEQPLGSGRLNILPPEHPPKCFSGRAGGCDEAPRVTHNCMMEKQASEQRTAGSPQTDSCRYKTQQQINNFSMAAWLGFA